MVIEGQQTETLAALSATSPPSESARPDRFAPSSRVMLPCAMIVPTNTACAPRVTLPATCQKTFQSWPPPVTRTAVFGSMVRSPGTQKIWTSLGPRLIVDNGGERIGLGSVHGGWPSAA